MKEPFNHDEAYIVTPEDEIFQKIRTFLPSRLQSKDVSTLINIYTLCNAAHQNQKIPEELILRIIAEILIHFEQTFAISHEEMAHFCFEMLKFTRNIETTNGNTLN